MQVHRTIIFVRVHPAAENQPAVLCVFTPCWALETCTVKWKKWVVGRRINAAEQSWSWHAMAEMLTGLFLSRECFLLRSGFTRKKSIISWSLNWGLRWMSKSTNKLWIYLQTPPSVMMLFGFMTFILNPFLLSWLLSVKLSNHSWVM